MCDATYRPKATRAIPRPRWGQLYGLVFLTMATAGALELIPVRDGVRTAFRCGLTVAGFIVMALWARRNRAALDLEDWCACAGATMVVRVIPSRPPVPEGAMATRAIVRRAAATPHLPHTEARGATLRM